MNMIRILQFMVLGFGIKNVFVQRHNALDRGQDIVVYNWGDGYSFLVNNPKCKKIQITGNIGGLVQ